MGKLIPPSPRNTPPETGGPLSLLARPAGPLQVGALELKDRLQQAEEALDIDELDRIARRYARKPASGAAETLEALAVIVRCAPELFARTEVDLKPERLEVLADRERALSVLEPALSRIVDLVKDSQLEQGDEVVELLLVGCARAQALDPSRVYSNDRLAQAIEVLNAYQRRVVTEDAHKSVHDHEPSKPPRKKKA